MWKNYIPDKETYEELQCLKEFVALVAGLKEATTQNKKDAERFISSIESLNEHENYVTGCVALDITDSALQSGTKGRTGVHWRTWSVEFNFDYLEIQAESHHSEVRPEEEPYRGHYYYHYYYGFNKDPEKTFHNMTAPLIDFVIDAKNYQAYITEFLNEVEVDIWIK